MRRRRFLKALTALGLPLLAPVPAARSLAGEDEGVRRPQDVPKLEKSDEEWRRILTDARYRILFEEGTERPHTSPLLEEKRPGTYICAACSYPLFPSETKYESGTGWPSFYRPIEGHVATKRDFKLFIPRTEYHCARCGGHQGHVFDDGPRPTGKRYCNNGLALRFVPADEELPALRT